MQVNLHDSPCISGVFLYGFGHSKTKFSTKSPRKYAILTPKSPPKFLGSGHPRLLLLWEGDTPSAHLTPLVGSHLRCSIFPPTSTPGFAYALPGIHGTCLKSQVKSQACTGNKNTVKSMLSTYWALQLSTIHSKVICVQTIINGIQSRM